MVVKNFIKHKNKIKTKQCLKRSDVFTASILSNWLFIQISAFKCFIWTMMWNWLSDISQRIGLMHDTNAFVHPTMSDPRPDMSVK